MTLVESPAAPVTMPAAASIRRRSSSPTIVRRTPSPSPSRRESSGGRRPCHCASPSASPSCKGKENDDHRDSQQHHHPSHPKYSHSSSVVDHRQASTSPSPSPSWPSSSRKRRLDGTPIAAPADRGDDDDAETPGPLLPPSHPFPHPDADDDPARTDDPATPDDGAGGSMDVTGLLSSQQRRPRRNSTSHHHDHNRSASPSPSPSRNHEEEGPAEAAQGQGEEQEQGLEEEERARLERSALEDSRVGEGGEVEGNWDVPCGLNEAARRTLRIEYWDRTRECKERKWDHMDRIDAAYPSREAWIWQSVLHAAEVVLEPNMFPYNTPRGIEHWTLWARRELALPEVEEYVLGWIARERPEVTRWNLDENAQRSIDIYHVHVYFQVCPDEEVGPTPPREPRHREQEMGEQDEQQQTQAEAEEGGPAAKRPCRRDDGQRPEPMTEQEQEGGEM